MADKLLKILKKNWVLVLLLFSYLIIFLWQGPIDAVLSDAGVQNLIGASIYHGWLGLVDYLSAHVLMCLIPAFFIAGAINTLIGAGTILRFLSGKTRKWLAYVIASVGGFFIEVCSCTILPLFAGIWKKGAGLGIATTFLYAGPAINIVAFILTGQRLGWSLATVRLVLSIVFAISIGLIMEFSFRHEKHDKDSLNVQDHDAPIKGTRSKVFWAGLFAILLVGTAPIPNSFKIPSVAALSLIQIVLAYAWLRKQDRKAWWDETIKFTTDIIPLLLVGVFFASAFTNMIPQEKFQAFAGKNTILTNLAAVGFGAIAYFPALVEVPIAESFMKLGMHKGPLLAYLLSDPVLSLQGLLIISKLIGRKKTLVYAGSIVVLTTLAGYIYGLV